MQPVNAGYHPYQFPYYPPPVPQDHELKKQYLALLPPQQIVEICLTFDIHVPPYVKSTIWPLDINAAIAGLRKKAPNHESSTEESTSKPDAPAMGSLTNAADSASSSGQQEKAPDEPQPPDRLSSQPQSSGTTGQINARTPTPQPPYPHQSYGFQQSQSGYPHAAYYGHPPPGFTPYPPPYPYQQFPSQHPPHQSSPSQPNPPFAHVPLHHPHHPQPDSFRDPPSADDLPSYEEMIVEALTDCGDSEGCAPKELFTWMASRYPLQSNFRPSASQALQKAFKRGRFEKSRGGKYRLNATWEGGNTSRRTTRRPQTHTQNQTVAGTSSAPQSSPFTHAPLVHQPKSSPGTSAHPQSQPHHPPPFGLPYSCVASYPPQPHHEPPTSHPEAVADADAAPANAYEAAQHILQAINFGGLFKMADDEEKPSVITIPGTAPPRMTDMPHVEHRAELQAMLALLAAQLAEVAHAEDDDGSPRKDNELSMAVVSYPPHVLDAVKSATPKEAAEEEEEDSDEDMEEVI